MPIVVPRDAIVESEPGSSRKLRTRFAEVLKTQKRLLAIEGIGA